MMPDTIKKSLIIFSLIFLISGCAVPVRVAEVTPTCTETALPTVTPLPALSFSRPVLQPSATLTPTPMFGNGSLWYEVDFVSQEGLRFNGVRTQAGCTAAALQMLLDFWHHCDPGYPTLTAQQILDRNKLRFDPKTGLNIMDTVDDLEELGYFFGMRQGSNRQELLEALDRFGPLLLLTKVNWRPQGANHMALLTGADVERDIVRVMDPWQEGGIMEFSYNAFDGIWGLNYADEDSYPLRRTFFCVIPKDRLLPEDELFFDVF